MQQEFLHQILRKVHFFVNEKTFGGLQARLKHICLVDFVLGFLLLLPMTQTNAKGNLMRLSKKEPINNTFPCHRYYNSLNLKQF